MEKDNNNPLKYGKISESIKISGINSNNKESITNIKNIESTDKECSEEFRKNKSLEEEYLRELEKGNEEERKRKEAEERKNKEIQRLVISAKAYYENSNKRIDYIIKNSESMESAIKAIHLLIIDILNENNKISINLLERYLNLLIGPEEKIKKLKELEKLEYDYKEVILLKLAENEMDILENDSIEVKYRNEKIDYIDSLLERAQIISIRNETDIYLMYIYYRMSRFYILKGGEKNNIKADDYTNKAEIIKEKIDAKRNAKNEVIPPEAIPHKEINNESRYDNNIEYKQKKKNKNNKILEIGVAIIMILVVINIGLFALTSSSDNKEVSAKKEQQVKETPVENQAEEEYTEEENEPEINDNGLSHEPTVKKSLPTRYSEYGDYDSYTQDYFMVMENLLTQYYTDYEKAVANSDYSYVRRDLVDNGQLSTELKTAIPNYRNKTVYVKHFSIYNFELNGDQASFNLDTVFIVDGERIQIETQRMTTYYDYYSECWLIDNYTDWDIIYKVAYNPNVDYFDFTNYRDYF